MWLVISFLIPLALGLLCLAAVLRQKLSGYNCGERWALAFAVGWGMNTIVMFALGLAGIKLTFTNIAAADLAIALLLLPFAWRHIVTFFPGIRFRNAWNWRLLLIALIIIKIALVCWSAGIKPISDADMVNWYTLMAKMAYFDGRLSWSEAIDDPPLPQLSNAWSAFCLHAWDDSRLTLFYPLLLVCLLVIFYSALSRYYRPIYSLVFTCLLATLPFLIFHAGSAHADFAQAFYYSTATIYLYLFVKELKQGNDRGEFLLVSALLLGLSVWAKRSGLYYALINIFFLFLFLAGDHRRKVSGKTLGAAAFLFLVIVVPWLFRQQFLLTLGTFSRESVGPLLRPGSEMFFPMELRGETFFQALWRSFFREDNWHLLGLLLLSGLVLRPRKAGTLPGSFLLGILTVQLLGLFFIFNYTGLATAILNETLLNRLLLHLAPLLLYFCAEVWGTDKKKPPGRPPGGF